MLFNDLYDTVCIRNNELLKQRDKAVERANNEIAKNVCLEIELAGLRQELKEAYREISEFKHDTTIYS